MKKKSLKKTNQKKITISLCMIVKNEEAFLDNCLKSVRDYVDEIVVVDTGSTDRTCEIAEKYNARIYHHPWENDFSKHRNQSLNCATGKWILVMDADEELFAEDGLTLRKLIQNHQVDYYHCHFYDVKNDGSVNGEFTLPRLFRNHAGMRYVREIHEQLQFRGNGAFSELRFRHYGYDLTPDIMEKKHIRTTSLLKKMLEENPNDAYCQFQLAASYAMHKEFDKAIGHGEAALEMMRRNGSRIDFFVAVFYTVAHGYYSLGKYAEAERVCHEALDCFPQHLDACNVLSIIYFKEQSFDKCRAISQRYLQIYNEFEKNPSLLCNTYCYSLNKRKEILYGLACCHFFDGDLITAEQYFLKAFEESGGSMNKAEGPCRLYFEKGLDDQALLWLIKAYKAGRTEGTIPGILQNRPELYLKMGGIFMQQDNMDAACDCLEKMSDDCIGPDEKLRKDLLLAKLFWQQGEIERLVQILEFIVLSLGIETLHCIDSMEDLGRIIYDIAETFCHRQQWHLAESTLQLAIQIAPALFDNDKFHKLLQGTDETNRQSVSS